LGGTLDSVLAADPQQAFAGSATPKTLVEIPGANHFGNTDLMSLDNMAVCNSAGGQINLNDNNGAISRADQRQTATAFLAEMERYCAMGQRAVISPVSGK
jgi:DNA polymerase II small subunit/DNA polymerase delta subunit B